MSHKSISRRKDRNHNEGWEVVAALWDGPRTLTEMTEHFHTYLRFAGLFNVTEYVGDRQAELVEHLQESLRDLQQRGWVLQENDAFALTSLGREQGSQMMVELQRARGWLRAFAQPEAVSRVTLGVHLVLAALKLPAAILSGSVGLLNDATDTLLDGLSSALVYAGLRFNKERAVNIVLVVLMLVTGGLTLFEAVRRFFVPVEPSADWFAFLAAILSALICAGLYVYQRLVGLRAGSLTLITQSVDSRNHVIVAAGVTAGLIAALLRFPLLDTLVGLAVAALILKSAVELAIELVRSLGEETVDLSRYKFGLVTRYEQFRQEQLRDWILFLVEKQGVHTRINLLARVRESIDFSQHPTLRALGLTEQPPLEAGIGPALTDLVQRGWLVGGDELQITDAGREHLDQRLHPSRQPTMVLRKQVERRRRRRYGRQ